MHFPACYVEIPDSTVVTAEPQGVVRRRCPFYLAAEEWIATHLPADSYLFTWQLGRTVVMGRNQVAHQEVNLDFCRENHIDVIRRKSGGGAIFADEGNIMISLVTTQGKVEPIFLEYANTVSRSLNELGAHTEVHGRNDVILMGKGKVCGNAFYHFADRNIVHGTMLYDTDPELMQGALHSNPQKLQGKGVQSIRARVGVLKGNLNAPQGMNEAQEIAWLRKQLREKLTDRTIVLDHAAVKEIEQIEQGYYADEFLLGSSAHDEEVLQARIEGCGTIEIHFSLKGSLVRKVRLTGDFFELSNAQKAFAEAFEGVAFTRESLWEAIVRSHPERSIRNLSQEQLIGLWNN
ncbi:MAG: lipoyltransferase [Bacteroidales bacterium]|nr:lipoyltransferase [Bacteroidales bacterium]